MFGKEITQTALNCFGKKEKPFRKGTEGKATQESVTKNDFNIIANINGEVNTKRRVEMIKRYTICTKQTYHGEPLCLTDVLITEEDMLQALNDIFFGETTIKLGTTYIRVEDILQIMDTKGVAK